MFSITKLQMKILDLGNSDDIDNYLNAGIADNVNEEVDEGVWDNSSQFKMVQKFWEALCYFEGSTELKEGLGMELSLVVMR